MHVSILDQSTAVIDSQREIPFLEILDDQKTIICFDGTIVQVIKLEASNLNILQQSVRLRLLSLREHMLSNLKENYEYALHIVRKENLESYDDHDYSSKYLNEIELKRKGSIGKAYNIIGFLVISFKASVMINHNKLIKEGKRLGSEFSSIIAKFTDHVDFISNLLSEYKSSILSRDQGLFNFWSLYINGSNNVLVHDKVNNNLNEWLVEEDIVAYPNGVFEYNSEVKKYSTYLFLNALSNDFKDGVLEDILRENIDFSMIHLFKKSETKSIDRKLQIKKMLYSLSGKKAEAAVDEIDEVQNRVISGYDQYFDYTLVVVLFADSQESLLDNMSIIISKAATKGIKLSQEKLFAKIAKRSIFPSQYDYYLKGRGSYYQSDKIAFLTSFANGNLGFKKCAFGDKPVALFKLPEGNMFNFTFHSSDDYDEKGHTIIFGGSKKGKSTLISYLLTKCLKYKGIKILSFDSLNGLKVMTESFGGKYIEPINGHNNINPFCLTDSTINKQFLESLFSNLAGGVNNMESSLIKEAIDICYKMPQEIRDIDVFIDCLQPLKYKNENNCLNLAQRLVSWSSRSNADNIQKKLFSSKTNMFDFQSSLTAIDMADLLIQPKISEPLTYYIFHSFENYMKENNNPFICFIDEMGKYMKNDLFFERVEVAVREWRKIKGVVIGAIQDVDSFINNPRGFSITKNAATYLIFPDPNASKSSYIDGLGLTDNEYEWIRNCKAPYQVMLKRTEGESAILDVNLSHIGQHLYLYSSNQEHSKQITNLKASYPDSFVEQYLQLKS
jgi:type IV secretion/conjugal transfer VirB4 family ATPase